MNRTVAAMIALWALTNAYGLALELGDPPPAPTPEMVQRLRRAAPVIEGAQASFSVTTTNREEVRNFFNTVYAASENPLIGWTGDVGTCVPGTTLAAFRDATQLRINFFRAMAGIPADITFDATNNAKDQQDALMLSANNQLNHFPPTNWVCYTADGADAAQNSNIAIGNNGPKAVDSFIEDFGANNSVAGHRRWLVYPQTMIMGTGDVSQNGTFNSANAIWVFDANFGGPRPATRDTFVSWPPPGFVPYRVVYPRWSFGYPGANFSGATVTMSTNGVNIPVTLETVVNGYGEETLIWYPSNLNPNSPFNWPRPAADMTYSVGVQSVIISAMGKDFNYTVKVFDPFVTGADTVLPVVTGNSSPTVNTTNSYMFTMVPNTTGHQWQRALRTLFTAVEGAENGLTFFTTNVTPGYAVIVSSPVASGSFAFHLAQPQAVDQILTYTRNLLPGAGSQLNFSSRLATATSGQVATVQVSLDNGNSWNDIYNQPGTGGSGEGSFVARNVSLTNYVDRSIMVRFRYAYTGGSFFPQTSSGVGWFLDNISFTGTEELTQPVSMTASGSMFDFTPTLVTNYALQARAQVYNAYFLEWGPAKRVTAVSTPPPPNMPPVAVCRNVTTNANASCQQNVPASAVDNGSSDPDGFIASSTLTPPGPYPKGAQQVVLTVTDNQGATATCTAIVTVVDNTLPALTCTNLTVTVPAGQSNAVVNFNVPATDNCGSVTISCTVTSGATFDLGTNPVTCTAIDTSANTNTCNFNIIVQEAPPVPHDFAVVALKAPKKITLSSTIPSVVKNTKVSIQNRSPHTETIPNLTAYINLVHLTVQSLGTNCPDATIIVSPPKAPFPIVLAPKKKLNLLFGVIYNCANDPLANSQTSTGHEDYRSLVTVSHAAIDGVADTHSDDDNCPRAALPGGVDNAAGLNLKDTGCARGVDVKTDVFMK